MLRAQVTRPMTLIGLNVIYLLGLNVDLVDVTSSYAVLSLFGPESRNILQIISKKDLSNESFPFGHAKEIDVAGHPVLAMRVTYVGELGWELHFPKEHALEIYSAIHEVGKPLGLRNAGYRAIETLRLEKGYRAWASDIGPDHTPDEAGLGWALKMKSNISFKGRSAVAEQRQNGVKKIMATFTTEPTVILSGRETIYRNGERCGWLSSAGYGYTIQKSIGMGYVRSDDFIDDDYVLNGSYELEVATIRVKANITLEPLYDPKMEKVRG